MTHFPSILFIGGGNMTGAMVNGLMNNHFSSKDITICDRHAEKRAFFANQYAVNTIPHLQFLSVNIIILSVKPQAAHEVCTQLSAIFSKEKPLIISVMAGITLATLHQWLTDFPIIRAMPNTPALIKEGATGLFANDVVSSNQKQQAENLLSAIGIIAWLENENQMDIITALSGSGPAYFFYLIEAMQSAAEALGLPTSIAKNFALQTAYGAAKLVRDSDISPATLRAQVTSKGGTTEAALSVFHNEHFISMVQKAMRAAFDKSKNMR